jgi:hypothetical protein
MQLYERHRPKDWGQLIGCQELKRQVDCLREHGGLAGRAYWVSGLSGTGKSTAAHLIAAEVADDWAIEELNGADVAMGGTENTYGLRDWEREARCRPISGIGWCKIVNEAHALRGPIITRLLTTLEQPEVQRNMTFVFTTTTAGNLLVADAFDASPFGSRVESLQTDVSQLDGALWLRKVATVEGLNGQPLDAYLSLFARCKGNLRECLSIIGKGGLLCR